MPTITQAETTIGLYKSECVRADFPFAAAASTVGDVEYFNAAYVAGYTQQRLTHRLGRVPPAEPKPAAIPLRDRPTGPAHRTPKVLEARDGSGDHRDGPAIEHIGLHQRVEVYLDT